MVTAGTLPRRGPAQAFWHPGHHRRPAPGHRAVRGPAARGGRQIIAEIDGLVELLEEKHRGKRTIIVKNESGIEQNTWCRTASPALLDNHLSR